MTSMYRVDGEPRRRRTRSERERLGEVRRTMIHRCTNPNDVRFRSYGARGIQVCSRWLDSVEAFLSDMGPRPSPKHQIDRIDNNGNYEPSNCRWVTATEQQRNKSNNRRLNFRGETLTLAEWSERTGVSLRTISARIDRLGWSVERALTEPLQDPHDSDRRGNAIRRSQSESKPHGDTKAAG